MSRIELGILAVAWLGLVRTRRPRRPARRPRSGDTGGSGDRERVRPPVGARAPSAIRDRSAELAPMVSTHRRLVLSGVLAVVVTLGFGPLAGGAVLAIPAARRWHRRRRARIAADVEVIEQLPEVVDLLVLALGAGLAPTEAIAAVGRWAPGPVGDALAGAHTEITQGMPVAEALDRARERCGPQASGLIAALVAAERHGTPLGPSLERLGHGARLDRRRSAEERARRVPVQLLFPLVVCILPAFALLTVVPLLVNALDGLTT